MEYWISCEKRNQKYINCVYNALKKQIKGDITLMHDDKTCRLGVITDETHSKYDKKIIISTVADMILQKYKLDYLISNFNFKTTSDINMQAFLKALVCFDSDVDRQIIMRGLCRLQSVVLESFFNFRLNVLKVKWKDLVNLANDNIMYLMSSDTFIELLKFLISNLDYRTQEVNVFHKNATYLLKDSSGQVIKDSFLNDTECGDAFLITSLIALSPQHIRLHVETNFNNSTINLLFNLFNDRIVIC